MSAPKYTPGPWRKGDTRATGSTMVHAANWDRKSGEHGEVTVALVNGRAGEQEANARLIAAAPELLAALQDLAEWGSGAGWTMPGPGPAKSRADVLARARAAIAKATGGEP